MKRAMMTAWAALAALAMLCGGRAQAADDWRLVMKNYSYELAHKGMTFFESVDRAAKDGFKYMEVKPSQKIGGGIEGDMNLVKMDKATLDKVLAKCKEAGIQLDGFGVARPKGEAEAKAMFENCKAAGITYVVMEPEAKELDMLDKLAQEYQIGVAIHNHPLPSIYWNPETVLNACKGRSKWIGACADTGHWMRSGLNPVQCLKELEGRIVMLHFKDVVPDEAQPTAEKPAKAEKSAKKAQKDGASKADRAAARAERKARTDRKAARQASGKSARKGKKAEQAVAAAPVEKKLPYHDVAWGQGDCNVPLMMAELKRQGFKGAFSIEYEYGKTLDENIPKIIECFNAHKDKSQAELQAEGEAVKAKK